MTDDLDPQGAAPPPLPADGADAGGATLDAAAARIAAGLAGAAGAEPAGTGPAGAAEDAAAAAAAVAVEIDGQTRPVAVDELVAAWRRGQAESRGTRGERDALQAERAAMAQALAGMEQLLMGSLPAEATGADVRTAREAAARLRQTATTLLARNRAEARQATLQAVQEGRARLPQLIPDWRDGETMRREAGAIRTMLTEAGFGAEEIAGLVDPRAVALLRDAWRWKQAEAAKPGLRRKASEAPAIRPGVEAAGDGRREQDLSHRLKRSGRVEDAAALFRLRMGA